MRALTTAVTAVGVGSLAVGLALGLAGHNRQTAPPKRPQQKPAQVKVSFHASLSPKAMDPEWVASHSSLIVKARVAAKEPAQSVKGHPVIGRRHPGDYAWHDFVFDQVELIWRAEGVPQPGDQLRVRVYNAETPEVSFSMEDAPRFELGERYILCLSDVDAFAFSVGPDHWTTSANAAFLIVGDKVLRKGLEDKPTLTLADLKRAIAKGVISPDTEYYKAWRTAHAQTRGIR